VDVQAKKAAAKKSEDKVEEQVEEPKAKASKTARGKAAPAGIFLALCVYAYLYMSKSISARMQSPCPMLG
jgi:hypothetical protein